MKSIRSFVFVLLAFATLLSSRPSQAAIGAVAAAPALVTAGLVVAGGGTVVGAVALTSRCRDEWCLGNGLVFLLALPVIALGILLLDEKQSMSYAPLKVEEAQKLQLTKAELANYNAEIDEINALAAYVDSEVVRLQTEDPQVVAGIWTEVKEAISPEAFRAVVKVTQPLHSR